MEEKNINNNNNNNNNNTKQANSKFQIYKCIYYDIEKIKYNKLFFF